MIWQCGDNAKQITHEGKITINNAQLITHEVPNNVHSTNNAKQITCEAQNNAEGKITHKVPNNGVAQFNARSANNY
jgi:hypothetical protein